MCKRKDNLKKIKGCQTEVNFRLDYYARPGALDKLFENMPKDMDYFEYKPTEDDLQIIGYDDAEVKSGTYQDTHQVGDLFIDLTRNIQTNEDGSFDGVVTTIALCSEDNLRNGIKKNGLNVLLASIVSESIAEITRCFTD